VTQIPNIVPPATIEPVRNCPHCGSPLSLGALVCPQCQALIHSEDLLRLSTAAKNFEAQQKPAEAREVWNQALALLPRDSSQAGWIRDHLQTLPRYAPQLTPQEQHPWISKLGPLAPIAIVLAKSKTLLFALFKLKFLLSLGTYVALYWALYGWQFGTGFAALILIHEMGHYLDIRRRGLPADMPVFLPGLGAYVRWDALGVTPQTRAEVSLAGPFAGLVATGICAGLYLHSGYGLWATLGHASGVLNVLNLTPVWILDGERAARALGKTERILVLATCLGLWLLAGQGIFFIVGAGAAYRLFTKDFSAASSRTILAYFLGLLMSYGLILHYLPAR
jgi:Zn-dependent protease